MADIAIFRINYKSDFILTLQSDAGWMTPFCIKFWTGAPSQAYFAGYDGTTYTHCAPVDGDPTKLSVQFDDHHLPIGDMKFQIGYHFTVADFPTSIEDEVINQAAVIIDNDGEPQQVMLDFNGETAPEIAFAMPAYANEAQRIANEQARIAAEEQRVSNEQQRISNEEGRISAEESRQENEQQRIHNEETRIAEFASLKAEAIAATGAANDAATFANEKAQLAADKAALAQAAATLANDKAQLAADKASLAQAAATLANDKAALAQQKADYAQAKAEYAQAQGDYAKAQSDIALADHERAETDHERAEADHDTATDDHTTATNDHTQAESDHTRAEADHTTAASDHTQASSDHDRAESDHTQAGQDHTRAESDHTTAAADHTRAESDHAAVEPFVDSLGAFDISAYHATGGVLAKYADLTAALGTNGANIPDELRKGGMSVKFVLSSDNKYVQYRLMTDSFSTTEEDWEQSASVEQLEELEDNVVMTGSYDATVAVGLADNLRGDTIVDAEFYKRKTGGTQSVGSGIAAIKEVRGKSIVWNQLVKSLTPSVSVQGITRTKNGNALHYSGTSTKTDSYTGCFIDISNVKSSDKFYYAVKTVPNTRFNKHSIVQQSYLVGGAISLFIYNGETVDFDCYFTCINLTLMFGAGKEPATAEEFEKMFPLEYYDYNAGEVIPFAGQNLTTIGKNQYNPATGKANLLGGQTYQLLGTYTGATIDSTSVTLDSNNCFTTTKDCVLDITGGNDTDTMVAIYDGENSAYEPYEKHTLPLDPSQWRDKQGNLVFPYGGMHGVGTAYDYAKVDADGYIRKAVKCFEQVDLGTLTWAEGYSNATRQGFKTLMSDFKKPSDNVAPNGICINFIGVSRNATWKPGDFAYDTSDIFAFLNQPSKYADAAAFKAAMQGVPLIYELATPVEVELATPVYAKYLVDKDGTEEITPANGTTPYTTPANLSILYAMDARGEINNLPKNYLSKESAENMLNAMVSAGVIASYTMTYDATSGRYTFVITKPAEASANSVNNESNI